MQLCAQENKIADLKSVRNSFVQFFAPGLSVPCLHPKLIVASREHEVLDYTDSTNYLVIHGRPDN